MGAVVTGSTWAPWAVIVVFGAAALVALVASAGLVTSLERIGARLGVSEALLGLLAALAANGPEITSAVSAMVRGQKEVGAGVVLGSNVFNVAALFGLGAILAGRIRLHRRVVEFAGAVAVWVALVALVTVSTPMAPVIGLVLAAVVFVPYVAVCGWPVVMERCGVPTGARRWVARAVVEEEAELLEAIHPEPGDRRDVLLAAGTVAAVIGASVVMERAATSIGDHYGLSSLVVGGVLLAAVTSLPNVVAAVHLAGHGRGSAVLSEALNSNSLNVVLGLLLPGVLLGVARGGGTVLIAAFAAALTVATLAVAHVRGGLSRRDGVWVLGGYGVFLASLLLYVRVG